MNQRIVCWIGDAPNHRALAANLAKQFNVVAIIIDRKKGLKRPGKPIEYFNKILDKIRFGKIDQAWSSMQEEFRRAAELSSQIPLLTVDTINDPATLAFTLKYDPSLVVVSGTSLIKEPLVSLPLPIGIMNLHTGLSPYVKGGPNCTNWCIANNEWQLIGNTIMWISAGIDSGNIIVTERTELDPGDDLKTIHLKVMKHAHDLYERAIRYVLGSTEPYQSIPQSTLGKGNLYLTRMWNAGKKKQLLKNLSSARKVDLPVKTIPLPS